MTIKRIATLGAIGGALAVWLVTAATSTPRRAVTIDTPKAAAIDASGAELASEIKRLHERLRPTAEPMESRDLFRYSRGAVAPRAAPVALAPPAVEPSAAPVAVESPLTLIGIAEDATDTGSTRTAIVSGLGQLFVVREQESVTPRYRVEHISADAVELVGVDDHSILRLGLK